MARRQRQSSFLAPLIGILFFAILIWMIVSAVKGIFAILSFIAIPLFILAIFLNFRVVPEYLTWLLGNFKKDPVKGLLYTAGSIIGYPLVAAYLAFRAYSTRNKKYAPGERGEYVKYEEVEEDDVIFKIQ